MSVFETLQYEWESGLRTSIFPDDLKPDGYGLVAVGGELTVEMVLEAYSKGHFPWTGEHPIPWFSPDPRLVLYPQEFRASRSLRKLHRKGRYTVRFDRNFRGVMEACATIPRRGEQGTWITPNILSTYTALHRLGIAHSVEVYDGARLCGGLYGLSLGRAFFGESMFSAEPNTSKLALFVLCCELEARRFDFVDCQQETPHLQSLGAVAIPRERYLLELRQVLQKPSHHYPWSQWDEPKQEKPRQS